MLLLIYFYYNSVWLFFYFIFLHFYLKRFHAFNFYGDRIFHWVKIQAHDNVDHLYTLSTFIMELKQFATKYALWPRPYISSIFLPMWRRRRRSNFNVHEVNNSLWDRSPHTLISVIQPFSCSTWWWAPLISPLSPH